eukprot:17895-Pyramimonas_sp.AAC.1
MLTATRLQSLTSPKLAVAFATLLGRQCSARHWDRETRTGDQKTQQGAESPERSLPKQLFES